MSSPVHAPPGQVPWRPTWSKRAVAWVGPPRELVPPKDWVVTAYSGEATNRPACTVDDSPARRAVPTVVHRVPSADWSPVIVSPERVSRSQRGDAAETAPGRPAVSWV